MGRRSRSEIEKYPKSCRLQVQRCASDTPPIELHNCFVFCIWLPAHRRMVGCGLGCVAAHQLASLRFPSSASEKVPACMPPCCKCAQSASLWGWKPHVRGSGTERTSNQKCGVSTRVSKSQHSQPLKKVPGGTLVEPVRCPQVMYRMGAQLWSESPQGSSKPSVEGSSAPPEATQAAHEEASGDPPHTTVTVTGGTAHPNAFNACVGIPPQP